VRFWDTSALVPLLLDEATSSEVLRWIGEDPSVVIWTLTPVELSSAVQRRLREAALDEREAMQLEPRIDELAERAHHVIDLEAVKRRARRLLGLHPLRAADALQLGAALEWAGMEPAGRILHTFDQRLSRAAAREGFTVIPPPFGA
jgi:uncharacterized protein